MKEGTTSPSLMRLNEKVVHIQRGEGKTSVRGCNGVVTESQLNAMEWALKFMKDYERKKKI